MHIFENPYVIILSLGIVVVVLATIGICFALKGLKAVNGRGESSFASISKMESHFNAMGKSRNRVVLYISLLADNLRISRSEQNLFLEIKQYLLQTFANEEESFVSSYDDENYVVVAKMDAKIIKEEIEACINEINRILLEHSSVNAVKVLIGYYDSSRIQVSFDNAATRAKQACMLAKIQKATLLSSGIDVI